MNDLSMIFAEGFVFVGKLTEVFRTGSEIPIGNILKDAVKVDTVNVMSQDGLMPLTVMKLIGDVELPNHYPSTQVSNKDDIYRDYIKLTTGIEIPTNKLSH